MRAENWAEVGVQDGEIFPQMPTRKVYNRTGGATTKYNIYCFDTNQLTAVETVPNSAGVLLPAVVNMGTGANGAFGNIVVPYADATAVSPTATEASGETGGIYCIAQEAVADNELCEVMLVGKTYINATTSGLTTAPGLVIPGRRVTPADGAATAVVAGGSGTTVKIVAMTIASASWASSADVIAVYCYFNGINGAYGK